MQRSARFILSGGLTFAIMFAISFGISDPDQAHSTRIVGIIAGAVIAAIPIYDIERWSMLTRTVVHAAIMIAVVLPCLVFSGWFDLGSGLGIVAILGTFVGFGIAGWGIGFAVAKLVDRSRAAARAKERESRSERA